MTVVAVAAVLRAGDVLLLPESEYRYGVGPVIARITEVRAQVEYRGELWWLILGFDYADGGHADLTVGSPDLQRVATTLDRLTAALTPCPVEPIQPATARWAGRIAPNPVDGNTLLHTDMTPRNFLVGEAVAVVDWSSPCRGAAWIDTALLVVRLIRAGHTPQQAETWAASVSTWATASPAALDAFATAMATLYRQRHQVSPATHRRELASAAQRWAEWRTAGRRPLPPVVCGDALPGYPGGV